MAQAREPEPRASSLLQTARGAPARHVQRVDERGDLAQEIEQLPWTTEDRDEMPRLHAIAAPACLLVHAVTGECRLVWLPDADPAGGGWSDSAP